VVTCGSKIRRDFVATTTSTALQRLKDAGTVRLGSLQMVEFAYGPTGHNVHYGAVHNPWNVDHITGGSSSGSGSAVAARLTLRRWDRIPAARSGCPRILRLTGLKTTVAASAVPVRCRCRNRSIRRPAGADGGRLRAADGLMAGADPEDLTASTRRCRTTWRLARAHSRASGSACPPPSMSTISMPEVADVLDETNRHPQKRGAEIVRSNCRTSASSPLPATGARDRGRRVPQALLDRAARNYGAQVLDAAAERAAIPRYPISKRCAGRGPALSAWLAAVAGTDAVLAPVAPMPAPTIAKAMSATHRCGSRVQRSPNSPARSTISASVAFDPHGFTKAAAVGMQLVGRRSTRRCWSVSGRRSSARPISRTGAKALMTNLVEIDHLNIRFTGERTVHAVNDLSLTLGEGEVLGLLGESGSGKSVTLRALMRLLPRKRTQISDA